MSKLISRGNSARMRALGGFLEKVAMFAAIALLFYALISVDARVDGWSSLSQTVDRVKGFVGTIRGTRTSGASGWSPP